MRNNRKGFTMAELLIVVAIIAVLVAVAIPVFNSSLEKSRDAVTLSNLRNAYAEFMTEIVAGDISTESSGTSTAKYNKIKVEGHKEGFEEGVYNALNNDLPFTIDNNSVKGLGGGSKDSDRGDKNVVWTYTPATDSNAASVTVKLVDSGSTSDSNNGD